MTVAERVSAKLLPYPAYQDSGVPWIGEVPAHWTTKRFKSILRQSSVRNGRTTELPMLSVSGYRGVEVKAYDDENRKRTAEELENYLVVKPGQLAVNTMWLNFRGLGVSSHLGTVSPAYKVYDILNGNRNYLHHLLRCDAYVDEYTRLARGIRPNSLQVSTSDFESMRALVPPPSEQQAIAAFLDRETTRIDELLREQEDLLEDLREKRRATINEATHAVPSVHSDPVLARWQLAPLKSLLISMEQGWSPQCDNRPAEEGEWGVLKVGCVNGHRFKPEENKALPNELEPMRQYALRRDDVLISRANTRDLVGSAARVEQDYPQLLLCDKLYRLRTNGALLLPAYLVFLLSSPLARAAIEQAASGASSSMLNISQATIKNLLLPIPPTAEQEGILERLDEQLAQIDTLVQEVRASIEDMRLHRSALITAAVTGKIDVRHLEHA